MNADSLASVNSRIGELRAKPLSELSQLPAETEVGTGANGEKLVVWHDHLPGNQHRVVVASYRSTLLGVITMVEADGFVVDSRDQRRQLTSVELAEFT